jgi:hypothetical protein
MQTRNCATCGREFIPVKNKQLYCCRNCFKKAYYYRRIDLRVSKGGSPFPDFICRNCGKKSPLTFDPRKNYNAWLAVVCPFCGHKHYSGARNYAEERELTPS